MHFFSQSRKEIKGGDKHGMLRSFLIKVNTFALKKYKLAQIFLIIFNALVMLSYKVGNNQETSYSISSNENIDTTSPRQRPVKSILLWNAPQRAEVITFGTGREVFKQQGCPVDDCEIVVSQWQFPERRLDSYDAILINLNDQMWLYDLPNAFVHGRKPNQRYIFFTQEPPSGLEYYNERFFEDRFYNWTMTYRLDSDIPLIYGRIVAKDSAPKTKEQIADLIRLAGLVNKVEDKTRLVAWMVSHCETDGRREDYVKELQRHINVDIYGQCGKLKCNRHELFSSHLSCYEKLEFNYKFYLSFENSICKEYVTEKFFNIMSRNIIPVVYGGVDYSRIAPPHSYIDARKFEPKQLAAYLKKLDENVTLYNEYFWWKEHYTVEAGVGQMARRGFCELCQKLHEDTQIKMHTMLAARWKYKEDCITIPKIKGNETAV